jgi:hypothetical protein
MEDFQHNTGTVFCRNGVSIRMVRKIKKWSHNITHEGAGRPSTATTDNFKCVRDVTLLDRRLTVDEVANSLQIMKNDVIISFIFLFK